MLVGRQNIKIMPEQPPSGGVRYPSCAGSGNPSGLAYLSFLTDAKIPQDGEMNAAFPQPGKVPFIALSAVGNKFFRRKDKGWSGS